MRPLRPVFSRHNPADAFERDAERLKNRDWVEILRVVHPSQADSAEREYLLSRLGADWAELTSPLLAQHSLPAGFSRGNLTVLCDHNTFANELSLIARLVEKKIQDRYGVSTKIHARASQRMDWGKKGKSASSAEPENKTQPPANPVIEALIRKLGGEV